MTAVNLSWLYPDLVLTLFDLPGMLEMSSAYLLYYFANDNKRNL
jgi:hypothetical protein